MLLASLAAGDDDLAGLQRRQGGDDPDVLDEIIFWNDDFWRYSLLASIALAQLDRVGNARRGRLR